MREHRERRHLLRLGRVDERVTRPCGSLGCPHPAPWLLASKRQRFLRYFCATCAEGLFKTGKFLMLIPKEL